MCVLGGSVAVGKRKIVVFLTFLKSLLLLKNPKTQKKSEKVVSSSKKNVRFGGVTLKQDFFSLTIFVIFCDFLCLLGNEKLNFVIFFSKNSEKWCLPAKQIFPNLPKNDHFLVISVFFDHLIVCKTDLYNFFVIFVTLYTLVFLSIKWLFLEKTWKCYLPVKQILLEKHKNSFLNWILNFNEKRLFYILLLSAKLRSWFEWCVSQIIGAWHTFVLVCIFFYKNTVDFIRKTRKFSGGATPPNLH